jgi:hypothetical protein
MILNLSELFLIVAGYLYFNEDGTIQQVERTSAGVGDFAI